MIDLQSDTVTKPGQEMRRAARFAEVGDDIYGADPTVNELQRRAAEMVGMEDALFLPSGTMGNSIAVRVHTDRGDELVVDSQSHLYLLEGGGPAQLSGVQTRPIDAGRRGVPSPEEIADAYTEANLHQPGTGLLALENTHNYRGGLAVSKHVIDTAAAAAHDRDVPVHLDGARIFNAAVALDVSPTDLCEHVDSVMFSLSKGLGAPVGSILAGPEPFIGEARRIRKLFGGAMRQVGIVAAPGLVALDNVDRLAEDHDHARLLADELDDVDGLTVRDPETNIVLVDTSNAGMSATEFVNQCEEAGVKAGTTDKSTTRFCTHRDLTADDITQAIERIRSVAE